MNLTLSGAGGRGGGLNYPPDTLYEQKCCKKVFWILLWTYWTYCVSAPKQDHLYPLPLIGLKGTSLRSNMKVLQWSCLLQYLLSFDLPAHPQSSVGDTPLHIAAFRLRQNFFFTFN